ncbi:hypothetical protein EA462_12665 [Natrarchaeobius halalkaliphilus]|uniref:Uncharacterized protein n=1 Tax=Natrarchaeobius halalkaliphilus TaxID=1679091 RepID=A0A3N6MUY1_9EURY|nr:DUF5810 domain-containing protein [Natrarchaeobius halalkaliphilus]RQG89212.1 hypothetical protein EA462_12665 [Natrarchaeobius halalkaliphilus]
MGYACPVCDAEQADAVHLANHLAVTASVGREDHLEWLDDHAPDWADRSPAELGAIVSAEAPEIETPSFDDSGHAHGATHEPGRPSGFEDGLAGQRRATERGDLTTEAAGVLEEARRLTRRMAASSGSDDGDHGESETGRSTDEPSEGDGNENA